MAPLPLAVGLVVFALAATLLGVILGRHLPGRAGSAGAQPHGGTHAGSRSGTGKARTLSHPAGGNLQAHAVLEAASDFLLVVDERRRIVDVSSSAEHLLGFGVRTMLEADVIELLHPDDRAAAEKLVIADPSTAIAVVPLRFRRADGDRLDGDVLATRLAPTDAKRIGEPLTPPERVAAARYPSP